MANATVNANIRFTNYAKATAPYTTTKTVAGKDYKISEDNSEQNRNYIFGKVAIPDTIRHRPLVGFQVTMAMKSVRSDFSAYIWIVEDYDENTLNYINQPAATKQLVVIYNDDDSGSYINITSDYTIHAYDRARLQALCKTKALRVEAGPFSYVSGSGGYTKTTLKNGSTLPYIAITYDNSVFIASKIVYRSGPASGYSNPRNDTTFKWDYEKADASAFCVDEQWSQTSAVFHWKVSGASTQTDIPISGDTKSITIPANTFPTRSTIEWWVTGTDEDGTTSETPVYTFSTRAGAVTATPISPSGSVEDGNDVITLQWSLASEDGQAATRVQVYWAESGSGWNALCDVQEPIRSFDVPAGTFPAGDIVWRVRAYNIDGSAGDWGSAEFVCVAAPPAVAGLSATEVPLSKISWQSAAQEAYEISIDGEVVKRGFGVDVYDWTVEEPLSDGTHTISVRVQGMFELWSQPSTITIEIQNEAPNSIALSGRFGADANLSWQFGEAPDDATVQIYRDGTRIASTTGKTYTDKWAIGAHSYYVELWDENGNYTRSNTVSGLMETDGTVIAPADGSDGWLSLRLDTRSNREDGFTWSRTVSTAHVLGAKYPVTELSPFEDLTGSYSCAFKDPAQAARLEALQGKIVIIKSRRQNIIIGVLAQMKKSVSEFYVAYSFSVQQIDWEDYRQL